MAIKLEVVIAQDAKGYMADMNEALNRVTADPSLDFQDLIDAINARRTKVVQDKEDAKQKKAAEESKANEGKRNALRANIEATMVKPWLDGKLAEQLEAIPVSVTKHVTIRIDRGDDGKALKPVVLLGEVKAKKVSTNGESTGSKGAAMTVDGTKYDSGAAAKRALLPDKGDAQMSREAITSALRTAGHEVS